MIRLPDSFIEDRALRDAARALLTEDVDRLRSSLAEEGIASRVSSGVTTTVSSRIRTGARDVLAQAKAQAGDNKGVLAVLLGAVMLFLARGPIFDLIEELAGSADSDDGNDDTALPDLAPDTDPDLDSASEGDPA